jgi:hypothetical protein
MFKVKTKSPLAPFCKGGAAYPMVNGLEKVLH